jgi:phage shock protein A
MGVFSRLSTYIKSMISSILDRAEDPAVTLDYSYQKQLEQLQNVRRSIADVVTSEKRLELQQAQINTQMDRLDNQARQALMAGREDLARAALERKQALTTQIGTFEQQIAQLKQQQQHFVEMEQRLSSRVEAFRTQKEMVKAQYSAAQAQVKIQESVTGLSEEMADVNMAVQRAQDKVLGMQARAQAMDQLLEEGALQDVGQLGPGGGDYIERQLADISNKQAVEDQLAALKQQMQVQPPNQQRQLPSGNQPGA